MIYNLKLILLDANLNLIENEFLNYVKNHLQNGYVYKLQEDWISDDYIIKWEKRELNKTNNYLMGDLFTESNKEKDIILRHLEETLRLCNRLTKNKYLIKFHISKLL